MPWVILFECGTAAITSFARCTAKGKRIKTTRDSDDEILQDLRYTYDAVGNIVEVADLAHETFYHGGHEIKAVWQYEYDALYRLTYATGREHVGTSDDIQQDENGFPLVNGANPNDPSAMRNYEEWFEYDQVGNILKMIHDAQSSVGDWTRHYHVAETSNRLLDTSLPGDDEEDAVYLAEYTHDAHGNMLTMPHLDGIEWDFKDQMHHVDKGGGGDVYFVYDASGQRVRKVWEHSGIIEERIYLGGFELYRRHVSGDVVLERETLHIMDDAQRIAMVETKTIDEAADPFTITPRIRYQLGNHLGSAMMELDHEGLVISYEEYHPYGTSAYRAVDDSIEVSAKRYRYTGKERDEETGLYYHGARYYACWLGRWTSADPAGMVDGPNLFQYVRGRPVGLVDLDGKAGKKLNEFKSDVAGFKAADLNEALRTVFGEISSIPHAKLEKEARAVASTIFNRWKMVRDARAAVQQAKLDLFAAKVKRQDALKTHKDLAANEKTLRKSIGDDAFEKRWKAAQQSYKVATAAVGKAQIKLNQANSRRIAAESYLRQHSGSLTLTNVVTAKAPKNKDQYEGLKKGNSDFAAFAAMNSSDQVRHEKRWAIAKAAIQQLAKNPGATDPFVEFRSNRGGTRTLKPREVIKIPHPGWRPPGGRHVAVVTYDAVTQ